MAYPDAATYAGLNGPVEFITRARVTTAAGELVTELDELAGGQLTFDEEWTPYVQASIVAALPAAVIDPRLAQRLVIDLGYRWPSGVEDVQQQANLLITEVRKDLRDRRVTLLAASDEQLVMDSARVATSDVTVAYASHLAALQAFLSDALFPNAPTYGSATISGTSTTMGAFLIRPGDEWWSHVQSVRDMAGAEVYCDELRRWFIDYYVTDESPHIDGYLADASAPIDWPNVLDTSIVMRSVLDSSTRSSRDEWGNVAVIEHTWTDAAGVQQNIARAATVTTGAHAVNVVGRKSIRQPARQSPATATEVQLEADNVLRRTRRRGDRRDVTARACYWFRPRSLRLFYIDGVSLYARVTRVSFQLGQGTMTLDTRSPNPE